MPLSETLMTTSSSWTPGAEADLAAVGRVLDRVVDQDQQQLFQVVGVAEDGGLLDRIGDDGVLAGHRHQPGLAVDVAHEPADIDLVASLQPQPRVDASQGQQVADQAAQALDLGDRVGHRLVAVGGRQVVTGALEQLEIRADRGERRTQLVGGVGDEAALRGEGVLLLVVRRLKLGTASG